MLTPQLVQQLVQPNLVRRWPLKLPVNLCIQLKAKEANGSDTDHSSTSDIDIYLNATEEVITGASRGGVQSESYNFDFYTKVDLKAEGGDVTVEGGAKLAESSGSFIATLMILM